MILENRVKELPKMNLPLKPGIYFGVNRGTYSLGERIIPVKGLKYIDKNGIPTDDERLADIEMVTVKDSEGKDISMESKKTIEVTRYVHRKNTSVYNKKYQKPIPITNLVWKIEWRGINIFFEKKGSQLGIYSDSKSLSYHYDEKTLNLVTNDKFIQGANGNTYVLHSIKQMSPEQMNDNQFLKKCASRGLASLIMNELKQNKEVAQSKKYDVYSAIFGDFTSAYQSQVKMREELERKAMIAMKRNEFVKKKPTRLESLPVAA